MHVNITIIGLNRVSASLGLALKRYQQQPKAEHSFTITGSDARPNVLRAAEKMGAVDTFHRSTDKATENADVIIVNAPPGDLEKIYSRMAVKSGAVALDMTELKLPVFELARKHFPTNAQGQPLAYLVGITPIAQAAELYSGEIEVEGARADLFDNAEFLITPDAACPGQAITLAEDVIRLVGGKPRFMDPAEHDGLIAATEGLPALLGVGLFYMLRQSEGWMELRRMVNPALALAFQNLRYQTLQDQQALFTQNRANLARHLEALIGTLDEIRDLLADPARADELEILLSRVQSEWDKWDVKRHSGQWDETKQPDLGPVGLMGGILGMGGVGRRRKEEDDEE